MRNVKRTIRVHTREVIEELAPPPQWIEPELCKLVTRIPAGDGWAHEIKFDGFRMMFCKLKALLRKAAERTIEALWRAIADCIPLVTPRECANYFEAAGYEPT